MSFGGLEKARKYSSLIFRKGKKTKNIVKTIFVPVEYDMAMMPEVNISLLIIRGGHRDEGKKDVTRDLNQVQCHSRGPIVYLAVKFIVVKFQYDISPDEKEC